MTKTLLQKLREPMTDESRKEILHSIGICAPDDREFNDALGDIKFVEAVVTVAASYVGTATAKVSHMGTWEMLIGSNAISEALVELLDNESLVNYTQAVMLVTAAIIEERRYNESR